MSNQCDLHEFFRHENQTAPASLSGSGKLHTCQKSQLVETLESNTLMPNTEPEADAIIIVDQLLSTPSPHVGQRHGMSVKRSQPPSPNSVSAWHLLTTLISRVWRSLLWSCIVMYNRSSADKSVNDARLNLFACKQRLYDAIPPVCPQATFKACCLPRRNYLGSGRAILPRPVTKRPVDWGWSRQGDTWKLHWTDISIKLQVVKN